MSCVLLTCNVGTVVPAFPFEKRQCVEKEVGTAPGMSTESQADRLTLSLESHPLWFDALLPGLAGMEVAVGSCHLAC